MLKLPEVLPNTPLLIRSGMGTAKEPFIWLPAMSERTTPTRLFFRWLDGSLGPGPVRLDKRDVTWRVSPWWPVEIITFLPQGGKVLRGMVRLPLHPKNVGDIKLRILFDEFDVIIYMALAIFPGDVVAVLARARASDERLAVFATDYPPHLGEERYCLDLIWLGDLCMTTPVATWPATFMPDDGWFAPHVP
jgi:hypothetical protein